MKRDDVYPALSRAIIEAQLHDRHGARLWARVAELESLAAACPDTGEAEKVIAERGAARAAQRRDFLHESSEE